MSQQWILLWSFIRLLSLFSILFLNVCLVFIIFLVTWIAQTHSVASWLYCCNSSLTDLLFYFPLLNSFSLVPPFSSFPSPLSHFLSPCLTNLTSVTILQQILFMFMIKGLRRGGYYFCFICYIFAYASTQK